MSDAKAAEFRRIIREADDLNLTQRLVLAYFLVVGGGGGPVRLTSATIATELGTTATVAGRARNTLLELGYLEVGDRVANVTYYRLGPKAGGGNVFQLRRA